ncbi:hypothetical protein RUM43_003629 [Polyplax serrata]|uniref:Immunoglobulin domain-containing protein n=1 Tax=Polyplax serrata TaxID=468196 RepID=A0AAN8P0C8_POLSC
MSFEIKSNFGPDSLRRILYICNQEPLDILTGIFGVIVVGVAWLRVDTQTILTIANHVITKNHRIGVTHRDRRTWFLHIKEVRESDRGWYMCQINTDPMKSQVGYIEIVGEYVLSQ